MVIVRDIWHSLRLAGKNLILTPLILLAIFLTIGVLTPPEVIDQLESLPNIGQVYIYTLALVPIQSCLIYFANSKYVINKAAGTFSFPRSDIENSLIAILVGARYWNLMRKRTVCLSDIDNIYVNTKRWSKRRYRNEGHEGKRVNVPYTKKFVRYTINVTGTFGSQNLSFLDSQKRDEVRNALQQAVKESTGKNIDRKVSEFS
jgi:hypothetical protein